MKIIFFGTSDFAVESLRALLGSKHTVSLVVTQPDRKRGRSQLLSATPVKALAESHSLQVYQPDDVSGEPSVAYLASFRPDLFVVVAYGQILKKALLAVPRICSVNVHGSLLPKYRGAAPTNWAVMNGDAVTGVTIMRLNERLDEGDIMAQRTTPIDPDDTNITLSETLADAGASLLVETIDRLDAGGQIGYLRQDPAQVSIAPKLRKEDGLIRWGDAAAAIHNRVRGLLPWPGAYTGLNGKILKILRTEVAPSSGDAVQGGPGTVVAVEKSGRLIIRTGSGDLAITHVKLEAGKEMDVAAFLRGHPVCAGQRFQP